MNIRQLIDSLEKKAEFSNDGYSTEVKLNLHVLEFNGSGYYIETKIEDVSNVWGDDKDECLIETVLSKSDLKKLQLLKSNSQPIG